MNSSKEKIIEAAKTLFAKKGYAAVRTKEIAALAGVNETTLFRNFKGKRELYEGIIVSNIKSIDSDEIFHKTLTGNVREDLLNITAQLYMLYKSNNSLIKMTIKGIVDDKNTLSTFTAEYMVHHIKEHVYKYFENLASKHIITDNPELITELYMNCINGYLVNTFVLSNAECDLILLNKMTEKIAECIK